MRTKQTPLLFKVLCWLLAVTSWLILFLITGVLNAWRSADPSWLMPALWAIEGLSLILALSILRKSVNRLFDGLWAYRKTTFACFTIIFTGLFVYANQFAELNKVRSSKAGIDKKVAIVGAGAAGTHAAWMLHHSGIDFTLFEAAEYVGGHAYSPEFKTSNGESYAVDIGFMFGAPNSYKELKGLLAYYGIGRVMNNLSISANVDGLEWASGDKESLSSEVYRFHELALRDYQDPSTNLLPFGWWLRLNGFDEDFRRQYLAPYLSVLFIVTDGLYEQSTRFILSMFSGTSKWLDYESGALAWSVRNGSGNYYQTVVKEFQDRIRLQTPVTSIERVDGRVKVTSVDYQGTFKEEWFDEVVLGVPADVAKELVSDATPLESFILSQVRYQGIQMTLHGDSSVLPEPRFRRNYNYVQDESTGDGYRLNGILSATLDLDHALNPEPIGTINPAANVKDVRVSRIWRHHLQDIWHIAVMFKVLPAIQGHGGVWYAGDWVKFVGHGPAMRSGMNAACHIGGIHPPKASEEDECMQVITEDEVLATGLKEKKVEICGLNGLYNFLTQEACPEVLKAERKTTLSQRD
ncbi:MAG: NAD(P)-binding protein [Deltaproteobacteria bacterium]|jgi:uncharacterized protein|nr:NAD(P)-binding protein [Deltaproteobacteria bacterium]MBT6435264.1 NAD(P)-binding protein [Deltaproteobacteria bacterium]MBT6492463.1 NAD(P)-binding protein [Deltaproteobacteria bacterium]